MSHSSSNSKTKTKSKSKSHSLNSNHHSNVNRNHNRGNNTTANNKKKGDSSSSIARTLSKLIQRLPTLLVPLAFFLTTYLYLYPVFLGCVFPSENRNFVTAFTDTIAQHLGWDGPETGNAQRLAVRPHLAPFRLLVLADPQLEGDSSLPEEGEDFWNRTIGKVEKLSAVFTDNSSNGGGSGNETEVEAEAKTEAENEIKESLSVAREIQDVLWEWVTEDIPGLLGSWRKRVDLFGNDYYLAHIFRTLRWWAGPTHVTVLGDLIGSQWVDDDEFAERGRRFWHRVFKGGKKVDEDIMVLGGQGGGLSTRMDDESWKDRIVNVVGNHDIGYAGDISAERIKRFEEMYGKVNWDIRFEYPVSRLNTSADGAKPLLHLVVLNSMLLDTPALDEGLQGETYEYLNGLAQHRVHPVEDPCGFTLVLTHVPLYKQEGICVDGPLFTFQDDDDDCDGDCKAGGLKEQNHLSDFASRSGMLATIFGMNGNIESPAEGRGRPGLVLNGHDHEGCDVWHYIPHNSTFRGSDAPSEEIGKHETRWDAMKWKKSGIPDAHTGIREVTLRSMMGEFGGNAGLLSAWFDFEQGRWQYDIQMCKFGVQHYWWAVHVIDLIAIGSLILSGLLRLQQTSRPRLAVGSSAGKSMKIE